MTDDEKIRQILTAHARSIEKLIENQKRQAAHLESLSKAILNIAVAVRQQPGAGPEAN